MRRALRMVWPPAWVFAVFLCGYLMLDVVVILVHWLGAGLPFSEVLNSAISFSCATATVPILAALYGCYRVICFHPFFRPPYRKWLRSTPWNSPQKLPMGPAHVVWQDLVLIAILSVLMLRQTSLVVSGDASPVRLVPTLEMSTALLLPMLVFLVTYLICLGCSFVDVGVPTFAYALAFGFGLLPLLHGDTSATVLVMISLYLIGFVGLRQSLKRFHEWDFTAYERRELILTQRTDRSALTQRAQSSWPFTCIGPQQSTKIRISNSDAILISLLSGWWIYVVSHTANAIAGDLQLLTRWVCVFAVMVRLLVYSIGYLPPISFKGRLLTGRWIIPGYDQILIAPLCTLLLWILLPPMLTMFHVSAPITYSLTCTAMLAVALNIGPTHQRWRLTGNHRIVFLGAKER